ncbi:MAG: serine/threonine-protein kinase [Bryobacteraceae bacterium]
METERFLRLRQIFDQASALPGPTRDAWLVRECGQDADLLAEARELLAAAEAAQSRPQTVPTQTTPGKGHHPTPGSPTHIVGPYRILHPIGEGGMGSVYLAVRDDGAFRKHVALKLLRRDQVSDDLFRRFHQERQVLAGLDHPNIARILDGGQTSDGLPYYVMEFVEGLPLDRYCDERRLDLAARVRIFQQLCRAIQYLHEHLVVHRDLKPSNILVTADGTVKLLDFGIAKLQSPAESFDITSPYGRLLTPGYASPEQISGAPITKASDIYSLGVILYLLLTGRLPHADPAAKLTNDPPVPSANIREDIQRTPETTANLRRRIAGDLDNIVLLCLRTQPQHRYSSAVDLAEDLTRFLEGRSVLARRDPVTERAFKFVKRNRIPVAVATLLLLLCGFGAWQAVDAQIQNRRASNSEAEVARLLDMLGSGGAGAALQNNARLENVRRVRRAFENEFNTAWNARPGFTPERRQLLDRGVRYLDGMRPYAAQDPGLASELAGAYQQIGGFYERGPRDHALNVYNSAAVVLNGAAGGNPVQGQYREQWLFLVGRIQGLGGTVPVYLSAPLGGAPADPGPQTGSYSRPLAPRDSAPRAESRIPRDAPPAITDSESYRKAKSRLISVSAKARIAEETMDELKRNSERLGQLVHPETTSAFTRMRISLELAQKEIEAGDVEQALESLGIAEANANRVLKTGGR